MKHLFWNCRGMGNPRTVSYLRRMHLCYSLDLVFLSETKLDKTRIDNMFRSVGFENSIIVNSRGRSGGVALGWSDSIKMELRSCSDNYIDVNVRWFTGDKTWRVTGFYGFPKDCEKVKSWELLNCLFHEQHDAWIIGGDFNEILWQKDCNIKDLGSKGSKFTWIRGNGDRDPILERLDRVIANDSWSMMFVNTTIYTLLRECSDHAPILLDTDAVPNIQKRRNLRVKRFEAMWVRRDDCEEIVRSAWSQNNDSEGMDAWDKIGLCLNNLSDWNKNMVGNLDGRIRGTHEKLFKLQQNALNFTEFEKLRKVEAEPDELLRCEEVLWRQRSRNIWLKEGDRNTSFFYQKASHRRKRNNIPGLFDANDPEDIDIALTGISNVLQPEMIHKLQQPYNREEIRRALF
ncbi:uncharacterized protein LOC126661796 [Mercurialis annua]|uniref:uncharacterized protein LOC126661796 n=1 Tax=Mercurialis annua TaxID=3986 RepID=UPI00215E22B7|nr:uncharacterized protein LOC126661796 [Mercurialis annua]